MPPKSADIARRAAEALKKAASKPDSLAQRISDRFAVPQLYHYFRNNALTHPDGIEQFLVGDDELPLFVPGVWHAPLKWRPIPGPNTRSLSRATLVSTEAGTALLRGVYGGARGELSLLSGESSETEKSPVGAGACGLASTGHWDIDLAQHHWVELKLRTDERPYELVLQSDGAWEGSERIWRADIPLGLPRQPRASAGLRGNRSRISPEFRPVRISPKFRQDVQEHAQFSPNSRQDVQEPSTHKEAAP